MNNPLRYFVCFVCFVVTCLGQTPIADLVVGRTVKLGTLAAGTITPAQITANQNDYAPTGYATAFAFRISSDAARTITGLVPPTTPSGALISLENVGSYTITLSDESASSTAANRFDLSGGDFLLTAGSATLLKYDSTASRWRLIGSQAAGLGAGYQAADADLTSFATVTPSANGLSLVSAANYAAMRGLLDLEAGTDFNAYDADLAYLAGFTPTANVKSILNAADYAAIRALMDLEAGTDFNAYDADLASIAGNTTGGFLTRTASGTYTPRTITGTANEITVTNGDGVSSAPTLSLPTALTFTGKTITGGTFTGVTISGASSFAGTTATLSSYTLLNDGTSNSPDVRFQTTSGTRIMDMDVSTVRILNMAGTNARFQLTDAGNLTVDGSVTGGAGNFTALTATGSSSFSASGTSVTFTGSDPDQGVALVSTATDGRSYVLKSAGSASGNIPGAGFYLYDLTASGIVLSADNTKKINIYNGLAVIGAIYASGDLRLGQNTTSTPGVSNTTVGIGTESGNGSIFASRESGSAFYANRNSDGPISVYQRSGTQVGYVSVTTTATAYNTSSGEKEKVLQAPADTVRLAAAASAIDAIPMQDYTWKEDGSPGFGPTAQQLQSAVSTVAPAAVTSGEDYDWQVVHDRKVRVNARAARNDVKRAEHKAAQQAFTAESAALQQAAAGAEQARRTRLGAARLALLDEHARQARLLLEIPPTATPGEIAAAEANLDALAAEVAQIPAGDRAPVVAVLPAAPTEPVLEHDPEDDIPEPKKWGVDYSKLTPALIAHAQVQKQRIDALEVRITALEADKAQAALISSLGGLTLIAALLAAARRFTA